jgi:glutamate dehydrogenase
MAARSNPKRDKVLEAARQAAATQSEPAIDPILLYGRASVDDLEAYDVDMLVAGSVHAAAEIGAWNGTSARVTISEVTGIQPAGEACSVLSVTDRNMPFLFDSVMGEVTSTHRDVHLVVHPIFVREEKDLRLYVSGDGSDPDKRLSHMQIHLPELSPDQGRAMIVRIEAVLSQVHLSVRDWREMLTTIDHAIEDIGRQDSRRRHEKGESLAFLEWLRADNFTFLGMREYTYTGKGENATVKRGKGAGLGILSDPDVRVLRLGKDAVTTTPEIIEFLEGPDFLIVTKANVKSIIHRRTYMDYVGIKRFDKDGNVIGELRVVGLFTSTAYTQSASQIPLLRSKVEKVVRHFGYAPDSHSGKTLINVLESYPRDDLFQIDAGVLAGFCEQIMDLADRPRVRALARIDHFDRFVSVLVYVPRDQYDSEVREKIGTYLKTVYDGRVSAYYPAFPEGGVARVHFIIGRSGGKTPRIAQAELEREIRSIATTWEERFAALTGGHECVLAAGPSFQAAFEPQDAFADLPNINLAAKTGVAVEFYRAGERASEVRLKIFHAGEPLSLSRRVPLLENLGFQVIAESTYEFTLKEAGHAAPVVLHDMELVHHEGRSIDLKAERKPLEEALLAAFDGSIDNDSFNRLVLACHLSARDVMIIRAYARYLRQARIAYSQGYIADTLNKYPEITGQLFALFIARLDPKASAKLRSKREEDIAADIEDRLASVPSLDDDRILRRYMNVIRATLRTNYFQKGADGEPKTTLAFKLDPHEIDGLPEPRPFREIFVYGAELEGIHLRFGKVARGGIRWSDRAEDYRTEVLGLVKAQQVKNAVIVPVGAKGGFYPKRLPAGGSRDAIFAAGTEAYKTYIRTLLSVTDNLDRADVVPPADTVRHDGDDPYFVVAADKGTATFSDTANALAQEAGFWLDDAFASGGSVGYDHKKMGITARGAWEAVKRHFREMDIDIQSTPFSVAGVGDMSGDVFGNGMLLSRKIRLIAAFDHRDIFIDPDPDMAASFAERQRLFTLPRSSWQDYDKAKLSKGGMIIARSEKSVSLTPEAAAAIGLSKGPVSPFEIMTAILKSEVDLLWFGGIGTYIRAASETDAEVGDRANDPIRIAAVEVRAKVIGEGANLGVTQKGRIAFGLKGGRCNSDAIDNSAGVNSSDVEVNIKIALANAMREDRLTRPKRNKLLASMTDEVAGLVLRNNYLQSLAISLTARRGLANGRELGRFMSRLEGERKLDRKVENLPDEQTMSDRYASGHPLTRAEIGVLLSYAKIVLFDELVASNLPDDPWFGSLLAEYFPGGMRKTHAEDIATHRLRREIISTALANHVINRGGPAFITTLSDATGASSADIVKAAVIVRDGFGLPAVWREIDALDTIIPGNRQNELYALTEDVYRAATKLVLKAGMISGTLQEAAGRLQKTMKALKGRALTLLSPVAQGDAKAQMAKLVELGVPETLAGELSALKALVLVPEIALVAEASGDNLDRAAETFTGVTEMLKIGRLLSPTSPLTPTDIYEEQALTRSLDDISAARRAIAVQVLANGKGSKGALNAWLMDNEAVLARATGQLAAITESGDLSLARYVLAASLLNDLAVGTAA